MAVDPYCVPADLNTLFGSENVSKWADMNNNGNATEIQTRILWACEQAASDLNDRLLGCHYTVPFSQSAIPRAIVDAAARWAGVLLYELRGIQDVDAENKPVHRLSGHKRYVENFIREVWATKRRLPVPQIDKAYPTVVIQTDDDTDCTDAWQT